MSDGPLSAAQAAARASLAARALDLIAHLADGSRDDAARNALLEEICAWQAETVPPYAKLVQARGRAPYPAMPTDVFRFARVASFPATDDLRVFQTSGTTSGQRGAHPFRDLTLYNAAAQAAARHALFPDAERMRLVILAPDESEMPDSSLSYMLTRFTEWFGTTTTWAFANGALITDVLKDALADAARSGEPVALLGTSFAFVHADDGLGAHTFNLPAGSRLMQTGGFKGKSREIAPDEMRAMLSARFGIPDPFIVAEYGMTELSSQMYESTLRDALVGRATGDGAARRLWIPGWVRTTPVHPETLQPLPRGETGLLRIDDGANLDSVAAIQTADLAHTDGDGIQLVGRAPGAVPRGCSLAMDEILGGHGGSPTP